MSPTLAKRVLLALAVVDLVFFGAWVVREEIARRGGRIHLPIEGYDPRDLLSGHYVRFQLVAVREAATFLEPHGARVPQAFCIEPKEGLYHVKGVRTGSASSCSPFLRATLDEWAHWDFGVDRFYVDERLANEARWIQANPDTYLIATVDDSGAVHPVDLIVNGKSLGPKGASR
ncbi:MAG TPA: GDYXXLXY domain-containing protein [Myxococcaceae bacterium]|nr:GDYXXLXY domain-containing protein [Myxococcaceae bacterium]